MLGVKIALLCKSCNKTSKITKKLRTVQQNKQLLLWCLQVLAGQKFILFLLESAINNEKFEVWVVTLSTQILSITRQTPSCLMLGKPG